MEYLWLGLAGTIRRTEETENEKCMSERCVENPENDETAEFCETLIQWERYAKQNEVDGYGCIDGHKPA